jgi:AcrR family transcriptional regulator
MADVALAAGVSRQTLYNTVSRREELIEAVVLVRIGEMVDELSVLMEQQPTFVDAMIETTVAAMELARKDPELSNLVETASTLRLFEIIAGPYPAVHEAVGRLFRPLFQRGRATGELREDIPDDELVDWIRSVYISLILRTDLDNEDVRSVACRFLLPSLTCRPPSPGRRSSSQ